MWANDEKFKTRKIIGANYPELAVALSDLNKSNPTIGSNDNIKKIITELLRLFEITVTFETGMDHYKKVMETMNKLQKECTTDCIQFFENGSVKEFKKALEMYRFIESMFEKIFAEVNEMAINLNVQLPPQYNLFAYSVLGRYRSPERESSNFELQELINGLTSEKIKEFYDFMEYVYNKYIFVGGKKQPRNNDKFNTIMNVGLSFLNINTTEGLRREVYVYTDFIKGQVDDNNTNKIFCPYVGDHLGNEFEFLVRMAMYGKVGSKDTKRWNIDRNRMIFSITEGKSSSGSEKPLELEAKPLPEQEGEKQLLIPQPDKRKNLDRLPTYFVSEIIVKSGGSVGNLMKNVNKINPNENLYDQSLLPFIKKNIPELYDVIEEWNENIEKKNFKLIEKMVGIKSRLEGENGSMDFSSKEDKTVVRDPRKVLELTYKITKNKLYIEVLNKLIESEKKKQQVMGGFFISDNNFSKFSRKLRNTSNTYTRKSY